MHSLGCMALSDYNYLFYDDRNWRGREGGEGGGGGMLDPPLVHIYG